MSDPLSIAASIAGLVTLADVIFSRLVKYGRAVKEAEKEIQDLAKEVNLLAGALSSLSRLARTLEDELFDRNLRMHHVEACNETLVEINKKMNKVDKESIMDRLKWPFSARRVKEWLEELSQHKQNINLALSANTMDAMLRLLAQEGRHAEELRTEVKETRQIVSRISQDSRRTKVLNYFLKCNPQQNYEMSRRLRHPRTGLWLTRLPEFQHWLSTPGSKLWLKGIPGAGKTVLAASIIEAALGKSTAATPSAFFFCDYKNTITHSPDAILGVLIYQLAIQKEAAYNMLEQLYQELHPPTGLPRDASTKVLERLLKYMVNMYDHVYLVVDGLDECAQFTEEVVEVLSDISEDTENVSMALLSRDEDNIRYSLEEGFVPVEIAAHKEDITEYVTSEIEERARNRKLRIDSAELKGEILHGLIDGAKGMFRWVACQLDHLEDCDSDHECRNALRTLPPTLNETYVRILERVPRNKTKAVQLALNCLAFASPKLTVYALRQILSVPDAGGSLDQRAVIREEAIMKYCRSFIRKSNDGFYLEFSHFSVQEFLENGSLLKPELEPFRVSRSRAYSLLAIRCLNFIQLENFQGLCIEEDQILRRNEEFPMYQHAAVYWPIYARGESDNRRVVDLVKLLFHPSKTPCFTSWAVEFARTFGFYKGESLETLVAGIVHHNFTPLHMAASLSLPEICSYLVQEKMDVKITSPVGTPIQCAVQGFAASSVIFGDDYLKWFRDTAKDKARHEMVATAETIGCLHRAGAAFPSNCTTPFAGNTLFGVAFHVALVTDTLFLPMTLLRYGVPLEDRDLDSASRILTRMDQRGIKRYHVSFQPFIESLKYSVTQSSLEIRLHQLVWAEAIRNNLAFTCHPTTIDTRVYLTEENMGEQAVAAVKSGNYDALERVLVYSRFDASAFVTEGGNTLLHLAMKSRTVHWYDMAEIIELLLTAGCNISKTNQAGEQPLHLWDCEFNEDDIEQMDALSEVMEKLIESGADCLWQDRNGRNILHVHIGSPQRLGVMLEHFATSNITKALESLDKDGYTPLSRSLANNKSESALIMAERVSLTPEMTRGPTHILLLAARANASTLFETLLRLNINTRFSNDDSPLHHLSRHVTAGFVRQLKAIYPEACSCPDAFHNITPLELYLKRCIEAGNATKIDPAVVDELSVPGAPATDAVKGKFWQRFPGILVELRNYSSRPISTYEKEAATLASKFLVRLEYQHSYESWAGQSGMVPFLDHLEGKTTDFELISSDLICRIIKQTRHWPDIQNSPPVVCLLRAAVQACNLDLVNLLLSKGVSVHQRVNGLSVLESSCRDYSNQPGTKRFMGLVLDHADKSRLNETNPAYDGQALIHQLRSRGVEWMIEELVQRGADPDVRVGRFPYHPALVYSLLVKECIDHATTLLENGANPSKTCRLGFDAALAAVWVGSVPFLRKLYVLDKGKNQINWGRTCEGHIQLGKEQYGVLQVNAIHLGAIRGHNDTIEFYLHHDLINDINARSDGGYTPLHLAVLGGHTSVVERLCALGCDINAQTSDGSSPLHLAARERKSEIAKSLIKAGCKLTSDSAGMKPSFYALPSHDETLIEIFESAESAFREHAPEGEETKARYQMMRSKVFALAFDDAILDNNLGRCQELVASGCDIEVPLHSCGGCSPLIKAIILERITIIMWLLNNGASLASVFCDVRPAITAIHLILENPQLIEVLPLGLESYLKHGGTVLGESRSLVITAAASDNTAGLKLLLEHLVQHKDQYTTRLSLSSAERFLAAAVNETGDGGGSALHWASAKGNLEAVNLLLGLGANVDALITHLQETPLHCAVAYDEDPEFRVALRLIEKGASLECRSYRGTAPILEAARRGRFGLVKAMTEAKVDLTASDSESSSLLLHAAPGLDGTITPGGAVKIFAESLRLGQDPHAVDSSGRSAFHSAICEQKFISLVLNSDIRLEDSTQFPWNIKSHRNLFWLTNSFALFKRKYDDQILRRFLNPAPQNAWSPLCRAASLGRTVVMENLILMGAALDDEGSTMGSPLIVACVTGRMESVVYLVRRGAALSYCGPSGFRSAYDAAKNNTSVLDWLLVGRYVDQRKLRATCGDEPGRESGHEPFTWGGPVSAELVICGTLERMPKEASKDYWSRLMREKKKLGGKVLSLGSTRRTSRPSDLVAQEYVRVHPGGYEVEKGLRTRKRT